MFDNLSLESEVRRTNAPVAKEAAPEVATIIAEAWGRQEQSAKPLVCTINLGSRELVEEFHAQAKSAVRAHEPRLQYRTLKKNSTTDDPANAYFAVSKWIPKGAGVVSTPEPSPEPSPETKKAPARRGTSK